MEKFSNSSKIILTFLIVIAVGTGLLMLPISVRDYNLSFIDALFMATSAVCVTGLTVVGNIAADFTIFGKIVLATLIEIGGLSFITIATFLIIIMGKKIGISDRFLIKGALNHTSLKGILKLVKKIIRMSLVIQGIGIVLNFIALMPYYNSFLEILGVSIFHTIASFNNSGLDIFGDSSMIMFSTDVFLNITTMLLIVLGGLGFMVLNDIIFTRNWKKFNLNTKIVLVTTGFLILFGALFLKIANHNLTWLEASFMSISSRTAGFQTIDCANLSDGEWLIINFLMFIGASPGSTGGGIKTSTFFVVVLAVVAFVTDKRPCFSKREISMATITKALSIVMSAMLLCLVSTFIIAVLQPDLDIKAVIFEVISAFSTTGLSMGITRDLVTASKVVIILLMFFGRLGPLTILSLFNRSSKGVNENKYHYVEENVVV